MDGAKLPIAYSIYKEFPESPFKAWRPNMRIKVVYDCDGKPFGPVHTWQTPNGVYGDGSKVEKVRSYGGLVGRAENPGKTLVDHRTLQATIDGCCPPALMRDFIMQEGGEMAERDPVLEAMKLRKRGYFGGGG